MTTKILSMFMRTQTCTVRSQVIKQMSESSDEVTHMAWTFTRDAKGALDVQARVLALLLISAHMHLRVHIGRGTNVAPIRQIETTGSLHDYYTS